MKTPGWKHIAVTLTMLSLAGAAGAQYVWLDNKGVKQFSDMPPPANVPKNRILKEPGAAPRAQPETDDQSEKPAAAASASASAKGPMTTAEKNADFQKRRAEQAEKDKKVAEQAKRAEDKARNCARAREYQQALAAGERLTRTDKNGERSFLNDEQRDQEVRDAQNMLANCK